MDLNARPRWASAGAAFRFRSPLGPLAFPNARCSREKSTGSMPRPLVSVGPFFLPHARPPSDVNSAGHAAGEPIPFRTWVPPSWMVNPVCHCTHRFPVRHVRNGSRSSFYCACSIFLLPHPLACFCYRRSTLPLERSALSATIHVGGLPRRLPWPDVNRSSARITSSIFVCSCRKLSDYLPEIHLGQIMQLARRGSSERGRFLDLRQDTESGRHALRHAPPDLNAPTYATSSRVFDEPQ
jgi:hypothetical protein